MRVDGMNRPVVALVSGLFALDVFGASICVTRHVGGKHVHTLCRDIDIDIDTDTGTDTDV